MGILALYQRLLHGIVFAIFNAIIVVVIHRAEDIRLSGLSGLLELYGTAGILVLDPVVSGLEVRTVSRLVTQRPEDDTRMVETTLNVTLVTFQVRFLIGGVLGQRLLAVSHSMRLHVGLGYDIDTVFIAKLVPEVVIRVVAGTNGVQVEFLHDLYVLYHALA